MAQNAVTKLVVIGGSAGSLDVLLKIVPDLPVSSGAAFLVVVHRRNDSDSALADILARRTTMSVKELEDKEAIVPNTVYIAPADYHTLLEDERTFSLDVSEKVNHTRPSIDVTFASVAEIFGKRTIGVLLSGANADGTEGLKQIKGAGGFALVQEPATADVDYMPLQAIRQNAFHQIAGTNDIAHAIGKRLER